MWNGCIKTNFHGEEVPYEIYGKGKIVLEVDFVYKHGKSYHSPGVFPAPHRFC